MHKNVIIIVSFFIFPHSFHLSKHKKWKNHLFSSPTLFYAHMIEFFLVDIHLKLTTPFARTLISIYCKY